MNLNGKVSILVLLSDVLKYFLVCRLTVSLVRNNYDSIVQEEKFKGSDYIRN